jgi:hypothetical protein
VHTTRLRLEGSSLEELKARVLAEHGPAARIVAAERITVGGVAGFFAKRHFEVSVEIGAPSTPGSRVVIDAPARAGIAALLEDAEEQEAALQRGSLGGADRGPVRDPDPGAGAGAAAAASAPSRGVGDSVPSTRTSAFAELLDDLTYNTPSPVAPAAGNPTDAAAPPLETATLLAVPAPLARGGDLVFVIGLGPDALAVATAMAASVGSSAVRLSGTVTGGAGRVEDRRGAIAARAQGVERAESTFVACGWSTQVGAILSAVQPDQLWVAVDAGRKPDDTARWVSAVASAAHIDAVATVGTATTSTPETVEALGLPIGWVDDRPATSRAA